MEKKNRRRRWNGEKTEICGKWKSDNGKKVKSARGNFHHDL